ncbi:MAG: hypothetical protein JKX85_09370 [Phycisphaeraceae bacterium]|nr:hypothetical protein [Phycisphaeraceae bacterium]
MSNESVPTLENGDKNLMIGSNPDSTGRSFNGEIDDVALWNRVLTPNEIAELATTSIAFIIDPPPEFGYAGIDSRANGVTVRIKDREGFVVQPDSVKMIIDGEEVAVTVTKDGDITSIAHSSAPDFFPSESFHTYRIAADSTTGGSHLIEGDFTSASYSNVDSANRVDGVDTSKGGFRIFAYQTVAAGRNRIFWSEEALRGEQGANIANMTAGPDLDRDGYGDLGQSGVNGFTDPTVINYEAVATNPSGDFQDDTYTHPIFSDAAAPGISSALESGNQNYSQHEIATYIHFPARDVYTMGVNSDDGFKLSVAGSNRDVLGQVLGFGGGGIIRFLIEEPGIYPMRLLWYNGTGGSHVEWYSVRDDGVKVLINDRDTEGALFAYYEKSGGERAHVTSASVMNKLFQADTLAADEAVEITLEDGITEVDLASVSLTINDSDEGVIIVKTGSTTTVGIESLEAYADSDIVIRFEYGDGSTQFVHSFDVHVNVSEIGRPPTVGPGPGILDFADANNAVDTSTTGDNDQSRQNVDITNTETLDAGAYHATSWSYQAGQTGSVIPYVASANGAGGYEILAVGAQVDIDENGLDVDVTVPFGGSAFTLEANATEIFGGIMSPPGIGSQNPIKTNLASGGFMDHDNNNDGAFTLPMVGGFVDGFGHANLGRSYAFSIQIEPADGPVVDPTPTLDILFQGGNIVLTYEGTLLGADQVEGPYELVDGASSPMTVAPNEARRFYQSSK